MYIYIYTYTQALHVCKVVTSCFCNVRIVQDVVAFKGFGMFGGLGCWVLRALVARGSGNSTGLNNQSS